MKPETDGRDLMRESENGRSKPGPDGGNWKRDLAGLLRSRKAVLTAAVLGSVVVLRLAVNRWERRGVAAPPPTVPVARPAFKSLDRSLSLPADIEAIEQAKLYAHISGYMKKIYADEGDKVKAGQLLADIDAPDVVQEYNRAKADADLKQKTLERYKELLEGKVISQQEFDTIQADADEAKARLVNATANMQYTQIRAPFAGSIARRFLYPGDLISEATRGGNQSPIYLIVNENRLRVSINVPQSEIASVALGHPVDIKVDALPGQAFHGSVTRIDALLDEQTKTQRALIDIDNPEERLRAGMFATVVLHVQHKDRALTVPRDAVQGPPESPYVFVVADGRIRRVPVKLGMSDLSSVEILGGLTTEEQVVVVPGASFGDGAEVVPATAAVSEAGGSGN